jgi:hypothetical protein
VNPDIPTFRKKTRFALLSLIAVAMLDIFLL